MKKSNKLLIGIGLGAIALFTFSHLALYARYKSGATIHERDLYTVTHQRKSLPAPQHLVVRGPQHIHLIGADKFAYTYEVEKLNPKNRKLFERLDASRLYDMEAHPPKVQTSQHGDTLFLSAKVYDLTLYIPSISMIDLKDAEFYLDGSPTPGGPSFGLSLNHCNMIPSIPLDDKELFDDSYFNALSIKSINSNLSLSANVDIKDLRLQLDDSSSIVSLNCKVGNIHLQTAEEAIIRLSGSMINKLLGNRGAKP
ncbi:MAG: hypothetical protein JST68_12810 [Bacteroidetes bacterium]|nr:hypothetical protein [Bacteroidota bacterium]